MTRTELLDALLALNATQLEILRERLGVPSGILPYATINQRAIAILKYFEQPGRSRSTLETALNHVLSMPAQPTNPSPSPTTHVYGDMVMGNKNHTTGDTFNIQNSGQMVGVAIGRGAHSNVQGSIHQGGSRPSMASGAGWQVWLSQEQLHEVYGAAIRAGFATSRAVLLAPLDRGFAMGLPNAGNPASQLLSDLQELNRVKALQDGVIPLKVWLEQARVLAGPRIEGEVFGRVLRRVGG